MSLKRRLEGEVEIKAGASDVHHEIFMSKPHHAAIAAPKFVQGCDLHEGELGKPGSVIIWSLTVGGKAIKIKNVIEEIDNEKMLVRQRTIEGDLLDEYKTITGICQVITKDKDTSIVKWAFEYEKLHPAVPELSDLLDTALAVAQHIDDHHHAQI